MGAQIAAHLANAGIRVLLLDIARPRCFREEARGLTLGSAAVRNRVTRTLFERMRKLSPSLIRSRGRGSRHDRQRGGQPRRRGDADWIVEAILDTAGSQAVASIGGWRRSSGRRPGHDKHLRLPIAQIAEGLLPVMRGASSSRIFSTRRATEAARARPGGPRPRAHAGVAGFAEARVLGKCTVVAKDTRASLPTASML